MEVGGGVVHLFFEIAENPFAVAIEETGEIFDVFVVSIARNPGGAGGGALLDGVKEAGAKEAAFVIRLADFEMAGAEFKGFLEIRDSVLELVHAGEGAVKFDAFGAWGAGNVYAWKFVVGGDHEVGIGFAVDEAGVVFGMEVFDEAVFGQQRFDFGFAVKDVEIDDFIEQARLAEFERGGGEKVGGDAIAQTGGFTDVDDAAFVVFHEVDAWGFVQGAGFF